MAEPDLTLPPHEAGVLFRLEMATTHLLLGYWRALAAAAVIALAAVLLFGQYHSMTRRSQREMSAQISEIWSGIPADANPAQLTDAQETKIREVADGLLALEGTFKGAAAAEAGIRAAELYRVLGDTASQRKALEEAVPYAEGPLLYAARSGIANLDLEAGNFDAAVATWRDLMDTMDSWLAEEAALSLAQIYEHAGRDSDARSVYVEFQTRWPDSPQQGKVSDRLTMLDARAAAPGDAPAPAPLEVPAPGPTDLAPVELAPSAPAPSEGAP